MGQPTIMSGKQSFCNARETWRKVGYSSLRENLGIRERSCQCVLQDRKLEA